MKVNYINSLFIILLCADNCVCQNKSSVMPYPRLLLSDSITINNKKLPYNKSELNKLYGAPDSITKCGAFHVTKSITKPDSINCFVEYECYYYNDVRFAVWDDKVQISYIHFENSNNILKIPKFEFSSQTNLSEIEIFFPEAYKNRNIIPNNSVAIYSMVLPGFKREDFDWIDFSKGENNEHWKIEFTFINKKLHWAYFDVGE